MKTIIVATGKNAPNGYGVQKYDNDEPWNTLNGSAPNGVNATRWLRKTTPDVAKLSPLAAWLVEHVPRCVSGRMPAFNHNDRVRVYNGKTEGDMLRQEAREKCYVNGMIFRDTPTSTEPAVDRALKYAERVIECFDLDSRPAHIEDWLFDRIGFEESDEDYWNRTAAAMLAVGATMIEIGENKINVSGFPRRRI
ncbi:MAG: hypothetical protein WC547_04170 [Candidatus Omnitrophota bacterium]